MSKLLIETPRQFVEASVAKFGISVMTGALVVNITDQDNIVWTVTGADQVEELVLDSNPLVQDIVVSLPWDTENATEIAQNLSGIVLDVVMIDPLNHLWKSAMCEGDECCPPDGNAF